LKCRPARIDDEVGGDAVGDPPAVVLLDHRQRHVDAGGDAGRCPDAAVADEDCLAIDLYPRVRAGEAVARRPVGGGPPAVEDAGARGEERAVAHRADAADDARGVDEPADQRLTRGRPLERTVRPSHHQDGVVGATA
jgi:hypothetical protein